MSIATPENKALVSRLRNAAPDVFEAFVNSFANHVQDTLLQVTEAGSGDILVLQGRAQEARALLRLFTEFDIPKK